MADVSLDADERDRMADEARENPKLPYMSSKQWAGIRQKLKRSLPSKVDVDWIMAALGTSEKGAKNILPQLRTIGIIDASGKPEGTAEGLLVT